MDVIRFVLRQFLRRDIYLMFLATFVMALMYAWRGVARNRIWWSI